MIMTVRKSSLALGAIIAALAAASTVDSASAGFIYDGYYGSRGGFSYYSLYRAPQPSQSLPGATSQPSNSDLRGMPYMGGRGMRGDMGGGRRMGVRR